MRRDEVRALLARRGLATRRALGQNFLVDAAVAEAIADAARLAPGDAVLEIGPGLGILTRALAARAARVVAVEIDAGLVRALAEEGGLPPHVELVHGDALRLDLAARVRGAAAAAAATAGAAPVRSHVVANLPYAISGPILRRLLDLRGLLADWLVLVQREVAARLLARPGDPDYGSLAVLHAWCARVERVRDVPAACFHPVPRVTSTLVRVTDLEAGPIERGPAGDRRLAAAERVLRAAFGTRRKTLVNALRTGLEPAPDVEALHGILERLGLDPRVRAEALAPEVLLAVADAVAGLGGGPAGDRAAPGPGDPAGGGRGGPDR